MHVKFFQYLCKQYIYHQKNQTFNTVKLKIGLRYFLSNTPVVNGKIKFQEANQKNLRVLGTMYFEMQL